MKTICTLTLALMATLFLPQLHSQVACGDHFQITETPNMFNSMDAYGDYVAWGDIFGRVHLYQISTDETTIIVPEDDNTNSGVFFKHNHLFYSSDNIGFNAYDLATKQTKFLHPGEFILPTVGEEIMAWLEKASGTNYTEVYYKSIFGSEAPTRLSFNDVIDASLSVYDPYITWVEDGTAYDKVWLYNTMTDTKEVIDSFTNSTSSFLVTPKVFPKGIYYCKEDADSRELWFYDFANPGASTQLTNTASGNRYLAQIFDNRVIFRTSGGSIQLLDITDNSLSTIPNSVNAGFVDFYGTKVIWSVELPNNEFDLYLYDLDTDITTPFLTNPTPDHSGIVSEDYVVYAQGDFIEDQLFIHNINEMRIELIDLQPTVDNQNNGSIDISVRASVGGLSYQWEGPNGFMADTEDIDNLTEGLYIVTASDGNGCISVDSFLLDVVSKVVDLQDESSIEISPNPVSDLLNIKLDTKAQKIRNLRVFNAQGQLQLTWIPAASETIQLDCSALANGLYFLEIETEQQKETLRLIKH